MQKLPKISQKSLEHEYSSRLLDLTAQFTIVKAKGWYGLGGGGGGGVGAYPLTAVPHSRPRTIPVEYRTSQNHKPLAL